jgi:methyl-accepting chemotaxis protein
MGQEVFYIARPLAIGSEPCLRCHSDPEQAPTSLINTYGIDGGFGWELNEIVAAQMIYVPAEEVFNTAQLSLTLVMIIFVVIFTIVIFLINFLLRRNVISPVGNIASVAEKVASGSITDDQLKSEGLHSIVDRGDELGQLSRIFEKMAHEVITREQRLREQVAQLRIEVDEAKKTTEVKRIVESDYFQELQERAKKMRRRSGKDEEAKSDKTDTSE